MNGQERNKQSLEALFSANDNSRRPIKSDLNVEDEAAYWDGLEDAACGLAPADEDDPSYMKGYRNGKKRSGRESYADKIYNDELASSRKPIKSNAYTDGYDAYYNRLEKSDNPYFKAANPIEQQEWERGWKVAEQDYMAQLFAAQEEDEMLYNSRRPIKSERVTNGGKFTDVMFELINELKLKKDYRITRPSWNNFDFDHKYRDGSFIIYIDEKSQVVYGSTLGFGEQDNDIFKYETEKINVDSYSLKRECRKVIIDCMNYLNNTIGIVSFE